VQTRLQRIVLLTISSSSPNLCIILQTPLQESVLFVPVTSLPCRQLLPAVKGMTHVCRLETIIDIAFSDSQEKLNNLCHNGFASLTHNVKTGLCINQLFLSIKNGSAEVSEVTAFF